jgi:3-hydroxyisobutyrate dehydrogenase-like beta-hydroxyacid dehydrogenase
VVKGVNQLMMGLMAAAALEAVAFGVRGGVDAATVRDAIGDSGAMREYFNRIAARVAEGQGENVGVKFRELPYFLNEAVVDGFQLPLTQILYGYCNQGERVVIDDHRPAPSFWHELMEAADEP